MIGGLLVALGFLTRIPVPSHVFDDSRARARSLPWYPLVGAVIGVLLCALAWALLDDAPLLRAALVLLAWVVLTGALHLDGLADSADAWVGGMRDTREETRARTLDIMKDPRSGPVAVVAVVMVLLLKFAALASLSAAVWSMVWIAPLLARMTVTAAFLTMPYARTHGLGTGLSDAPRAASVIALAMGVVACAAVGLRGIVALAAVLVVSLWWRRACMRRIGGTTGDTAGALVELSEAAALVALALA
jgi:adenosylcobinamide-GDP ribazoletransferase